MRTIIHHNYKPYWFAWVDAEGWVPINGTGERRLSTVPTAAWKKLADAREREVRHCKTCKWWTEEAQQDGDWRYCAHRKLNVQPLEYQDADCQGGAIGDKDIGIWPHRNFGCIHHSPRA